MMKTNCGHFRIVLTSAEGKGTQRSQFLTVNTYNGTGPEMFLGIYLAPIVLEINRKAYVPSMTASVEEPVYMD
jgi:hypothetical protein